ncbi:1-aminocyclopropane-1-carboxylate synthase 2 [Smittium mucronatum]|uniref:1-aminocyclopropane-1-carboxylate synthase 2 n=1 Tax=Smittium mucronatum TaxID=133383 RepID=A0A1R0GZJ1_9FUNG|nr:1-aminocyclopropane-1-carboxylate synthase 2 [Smittium mucronatum]
MTRELFLSNSTIENISNKDSSFAASLKAMKDVYHPVKNPSGVLNLGVALNVLQEDILYNKDLEYGNACGSEELRYVASMIINKYFNPSNIVNSSQLIITNGLNSAIDKLSSVICNPGDAVLISEPYHAPFVDIVNLVAKAVVHGVPVPPCEIQSPSQVNYYESKYRELSRLGITVKMIILCNPHNPTGKVYSRAALEAILRFANKYDIYVIFDEIYALSVYRSPTENIINLIDTPNGYFNDLYTFESVLSFDNLDELIDPRLIVVVHGTSKDFCMHGFKVGWIISPFNPDIIKALTKISPFSYISALTDRIVTSILSDAEFIDYFIKTVNYNLYQNYIKTTTFLDKKGIFYIPAQAGLFIMVDIKPFLLIWKNNHLKTNESMLKSTKDLTFEDEQQLWIASIERGRIYYSPGVNFKAHEPGWIRLVFSQPWDSLKLGLERLIEFFENDSSIYLGASI